VFTLVILGNGGRLGAAMARGYAGEARVIGFNHSQLDLASPQAIDDALGGLDFDTLINCAALINVDYCETHPEEAFAVNARAVGQIAQLCARKHARCIHISTDYVFDGTQSTPYTETDPAHPLSVYGESKRQGEIECLAASAEHLAARVSWVFGPDRPSFLDQILQCARRGDSLQAIGDKWSTPTYTLDLLEWLRPLLRDRAVGGLLHLASTGSCTWQEYGQWTLDCAIRTGLPLKSRTVAFQSLSDLKAFVARRPIHTTLDTGRFTALTGITPRPWQESVEEYVREYHPG